MVGGGEGAFIGAVHRAAAGLDQTIELVCGAFASDAERSRRSGASLGLAPERCYADFDSMFAAEAKLPAGKRMEFVAIVTPNDLHLPVATGAFEHGFHVLSDKPATRTLAECIELRDSLKASGCLYGLTHPYAAYPLVVEAAERVRAGQLGTVRKILVEYTQGWLAEPIERRGQKQAIWRLDPKRAGASSCMGDIGVHAFHLAEFVTSLRTTELCADLNSLGPGRGVPALRQWRARRAGREPDLHRRRERPALARLWRRREPRVASAGAELAVAQARAQARRARQERRVRFGRRGPRELALAVGPP